jgi:anti-sigma regulatory factor (Ser/Thr protein kinase)
MSAWWCDWAASIGLRADLKDRGELCLNEAVANIIQHGGRAHTIAITLDGETAAVRMTIADDGLPFDPATYPVADITHALDDTSPGGLGLHIVRNSTDALQYDRVGGWNTLTLTLMR